MPVSVIVPIHNAGAFLHETLESIYDALSDGDELITVFDSCTDNSRNVYDQWQEAKTASPAADVAFVHFDVEFHAISLSRNLGIESATRPWMAFVDHDDLVSPEIYRQLIAQGEATGVDVVRSGYAKFSRFIDEEIYPDFAPDFYAFFGMFVWNGVFRRDLLKNNAIRFVPGYGEDYEFNLQVARHANGQHYVNSCFYFWRIHDSNHHKKRTPEDFFKRVSSLIDNCGEYILACPNAQYAFTRWFIDYLNYLNTIFQTAIVADAMTVCKDYTDFFYRLLPGLSQELSVCVQAAFKKNHQVL